MSPDFELLMQHLRARTGEVELDVPSPAGSSDEAVASYLARALHPSRIGEVMGVLREVSHTSQVIVATHHPLVINELQPDEVTLITRTPERGTIATPLSQTKNFEQRSKVYALGELWLNYADGELESDLVAESTIPAPATSAGSR